MRAAVRRARGAGLPANEALSLGVHESQSLLWERMVALSPAFCTFLLPRIQDKFPAFGQGKTAQVRGAWPQGRLRPRAAGAASQRPRPCEPARRESLAPAPCALSAASSAL